MWKEQEPGASAPWLDLASIGAALYGSAWRGALAHDLGLSGEAEVLQCERSGAPLAQWLREALIGIAQRRAANALELAGLLALESGVLSKADRLNAA